MRGRFIAGTITTLLVLAGTGTGAARSAERGPVPGPTIRFAGRQVKADDSPALRFSIETPAKARGWVSAYVPDPQQRAPRAEIQPLYRIELLRDGKWVDQDLGWCGMGVGNVKMAPMSRRSFSVMEPPGEWQAMRAGVTWIAEAGSKPRSRTVWSAPVPRKQLSANSL